MMNIDINMDTVLEEILGLHDNLLALEDEDLNTMQHESVDTMIGLSSRLCVMWVTSDELERLSTQEKGLLRHDFMNKLHGILGFTTLMLRDNLVPHILDRVQAAKSLAKEIERNMLVLTKGYIPEVIE